MPNGSMTNSCAVAGSGYSPSSAKRSHAKSTLVLHAVVAASRFARTTTNPESVSLQTDGNNTNSLGRRRSRDGLVIQVNPHRNHTRTLCYPLAEILTETRFTRMEKPTGEKIPPNVLALFHFS